MESACDIWRPEGASRAIDRGTRSIGLPTEQRDAGHKFVRQYRGRKGIVTQVMLCTCRMQKSDDGELEELSHVWSQAWRRIEGLTV